MPSAKKTKLRVVNPKSRLGSSNWINRTIKNSRQGASEFPKPSSMAPGDYAVKGHSKASHKRMIHRVIRTMGQKGPMTQLGGKKSHGMFSGYMPSLQQSKRLISELDEHFDRSKGPGRHTRGPARRAAVDSIAAITVSPKFKRWRPSKAEIAEIEAGIKKRKGKPTKPPKILQKLLKPPRAYRKKK